MRSFLLLASMPLFLVVFESLRGQVFDGFDPAAVKGQRVFIGGASTGIGEQMAYRYATLGAHVALLSRRQVHYRSAFEVEIDCFVWH